MNRKTVSFGVIFSLLLGILLLWLSPDDRSLGSLLKLVYLHGALINTGLILFTAAGIVSLLSLFRNNAGFFLLFAIEKTAISFWIAATIIGDVTSQLAWGGLFWGEPRFSATIIISLMAVSIYFISTATGNPKVISLLGTGLAVAVWVLMISARKVMHPDNPFGVSEPSIKFFFGAITIVFLIAAILIVRLIYKKEMR
ncbi:MAG: hypothetical protein OIN66_16785 [Candidatus Methanoperedens sp.]|nr:hypothetical protein [Candidatus Methanoperedens sp.]